MDNKKIGKLIADLRRKQGLTQEQLGEKVGVGFRSVSKWECGKTLPDIGIINDLSKILGISSDELLSGELKSKEDNNDKKKISPKIIITISILTLIIIFISTVYTYENNKTYTYQLFSEEKEEYYIEGTANLKNDNISVSINSIYFKDEDFNNLMIENYEYSININNTLLFKLGFIDGIDYLENSISIKEFSDDLLINFTNNTKTDKEELVKDVMVLKFKFLTEDNQIITKELKIKLSNEDK